MHRRCGSAFHKATDHGTFEPERKVAGISEQGHFENLETVYQGNAVCPAGQAVKIPQFPEESAYQSSQGGGYHRAPITLNSGGENMGLPTKSLQAGDDQQR